ncbi:MAG: manganese efflux pump MntP family protein [Oscillospiraceae bacterium]|nr:manganese efflux pump MntP family protein [Oscillospiraceae bacterium]
MGFIEFFLTGIGLSMDAFAVAICKGLGMRKVNYKQMLLIALFFGGFQALMPLLGWLLGRQFEQYITSVDHWIAFALLVLIGANMLREARKEDDTTDAETVYDAPLPLGQLLLMAIATSIDALAVGISFAFLGVNIWLAIAIIGTTTFLISAAGVFIGNRFGNRYEKRATIAGGIILILLGVKILLEHLGVIAFNVH